MSAETMVDSAGSEIADGPEGSKKRVDPGFKRNVLVIAGVAVLAVIAMVLLVMMMRGGAKAITETKSDLSLQEGSPLKSSDGLTPAMREKLLRAQNRESSEAGAKEQSYIPPDILPEKLQPAQAGQNNPPAVYAQASANPGDDKRNQARLAAAQAMLGGMLQRPQVERVSIAKIDPPATPPAAAASTAGPAAVLDPFVDIMEIFGARLTSPVDTDMSTFASAEVTTGKLAGALLIGSVKIVGNGLEFKFTGMRHDKHTYAINAIALDAQTSTSAVQGDLDRKVLTRYVFPILMATAGAYATARSQVSTTTTSLGYGANPNVGNGLDSNSNYGIAKPAPTEQQAIAAGVAAGVQIGNQAVGAGAREPIRVSMPAGESIGVMFRDAVAFPSPTARAR